MLENLEIPAGFGLVIASFCKRDVFEQDLMKN